MTSSKKGILFLLPQLYPCVTGGVEIFHYYFVQAISRYYDVFISTTCNQLPQTDKFTILRFPQTLLSSRSLALSYYSSMHVFRTRHNVSLVHIPYTSKSIHQRYFAIAGKRLFNIPYILRIHGGGMHPSRPFCLHQMLFDNAAGIIAVSTPIKKEYEARHGRSIGMIPSMLPYNKTEKNPLELRSKYGLDVTDLVVLFLGTIKSIKGPDTLLQAFLNLGADYVRGHRLNLVFAGNGPLLSQLRQSVEGTEFANYVHFLGNVPYEHVCELYALTDCFVIPSLKEARPLTLSEAMHNGVPTIGSDISTIANIIKDGENGLLFKTADVSDLKNQLVHIIEHPELRKRLGDEAKRSYASKYHFDKMVDDYLVFYDSIIQRTRDNSIS